MAEIWASASANVIESPLTDAFAIALKAETVESTEGLGGSKTSAWAFPPRSIRRSAENFSRNNDLSTSGKAMQRLEDETEGGFP
jgi:hypothetical protein